mgnify:CR=1 FL=1
MGTVCAKRKKCLEPVDQRVPLRQGVFNSYRTLPLRVNERRCLVVVQDRFREVLTRQARKWAQEPQPSRAAMES